MTPIKYISVYVGKGSLSVICYCVINLKHWNSSTAKNASFHVKTRQEDPFPK